MSAGKQQRARLQRELREQEKVLERLLDQAVGPSSPPDEWIIEGLRLWIQVFFPDRITVRLFPFEDRPEFQLLGNLKRGSFVDADVGNLLFAYGTQPNIKLTLVGLVTSIPAEKGRPFDSLAGFPEVRADLDREVDEDSSTVDLADGEPDLAGFEKGFRSLFNALDGLDAFSRFARYPNITVYPLAVYRRVPISGASS